MARQLQIQHLDAIPPEQLNPELVRRLPLEFLKKQRAIPLVLEDDQIAIALADPFNVEAYDAIATVLGRPCGRVTCSASEIEKSIGRCYYQNAGIGSDADDLALEESLSDGDDAHHSGGGPHAEDLLNIANKAPVIKLVNKIFFQAVHSRASDIHIEPYEDEARVRFRVDGVLHDISSLPKAQVAALVSRLKIMANLNIAERRLPQDGQSRIKIGQNLMDIRVSVVPTSGGERVVLRLLDKGTGELGLTEGGFSQDVLDRLRELIRLTHGIILLTGPTGSGKTTTLYAAMTELNSEERNILTVEDLRAGREFPDAIAVGRYPLDAHKPDDDKRTYLLPKNELAVPPYQIPLRSLIPLNSTNLLVAGRNLSADQLAMSSARVMTTCAFMGQAAGIVLAYCCQNHCLIFHLQ